MKNRGSEVIYAFSSSRFHEQLAALADFIPPELAAILGYLFVPGGKPLIQRPVATDTLRTMMHKHLGGRIILDGIHREIMEEDGRFTLSELA